MSEPKKQHLYLFFEENESRHPLGGFDLSSNLVKIAMNKFVIDEAAQAGFRVLPIINFLIYHGTI